MTFKQPTYETQTANGHTITCSAWKSSGRIHFTVHIDGSEYTTGTSDDDMGRSSAADEAKHQADTLALDIAHNTPIDVRVYDSGSSTRFIVNALRRVELATYGGVPAAELLAGKLLPSYNREELADEILAAWENGYEGDPVANGLTVEFDGVPVAVSQ